MLYLCIRSCNGVGCHFTSLEAALATGLCRGCGGGSVARQRGVLCLILLARIWKGSKLASVSTALVAVELRAPVIRMATLLCMVTNSLIITCQYSVLPLEHLPMFLCGVRNMSVE